MCMCTDPLVQQPEASESASKAYKYCNMCIGGQEPSERETGQHITRTVISEWRGDGEDGHGSGGTGAL